MGISSSQLRLLYITGRKHNIELKAQRLHAEKLSLATQENEAYVNYNKAMDAKKLQVSIRGATGDDVFVDANFSTVCKFNDNRIRQYHLFNNQTGKIVVPENVANMYDKYSNDKYIFAWAMLGFEGDGAYGEGCMIQNGHYVYGAMAHLSQENIEFLVGDTENCTVIESIILSEISQDNGGFLPDDLQEIYDELDPLCDPDINPNPTPEQQARIRKLREEYRDLIYSKYAEEIFHLMNYDLNQFNTNNYWGDTDVVNVAMTDEDNQKNPNLTWSSIKDEFEYYVNLWEAIRDAGGYEIVASNHESGEEGNNWFQNMIEAGLLTLREFKDGLCGGWTDVNLTTSIGDNYFQEVEDEDKVKRAQTEYEHILRTIDNKEKVLDNSLKKLESEEKALTTQEDGLKQLIQQNIEKTFNLDA